MECERLFGIVPPLPALSGGELKLMWLCEQLLMNLLIDVQAQQHACAYILHMIDTTLFLDYFTNKVYLRWLPLLEDFDACGAMSWGHVVLAFLYMELYKVSTMRISEFCGRGTLLQVIRVIYLFTLI